MTIAIRPLETIEDLRSAVTLQTAVMGERSRLVWGLPQLLHIRQSGGLVLGAQEEAIGLRGLLIDLVAVADGYPACRTVAWGVESGYRNLGIGTSLRGAERRLLQDQGVDLVFWDVDPLLSGNLYVALRKLGGLATGYRRDALGGIRDAQSPGLATDRLRIEWWLDAPRVNDTLDGKLPPSHDRIGLHRMDVLTKTTVLGSGMRGLSGDAAAPTSEHVLVEIPENLAELQRVDHDAAIQWRLRSRDIFDKLFELEYLGIGLIHEAGRSFLLFKKGTRRTELRTSEGR